MSLSKDAKLVCGITLLVIPTIMYGGWTLLGYLTHGSASPMPPNLRLDDTQWALWRAGHAHAGVWTILSLLLQIFLDFARVSPALRWFARIAAPAAAILLSAGFFRARLFSRFPIAGLSRHPRHAGCTSHYWNWLTEKRTRG